jgi:hypothetical protein
MSRKSHPLLCLEVLEDRTAPASLGLGSVEVNPQPLPPRTAYAPSPTAIIGVLIGSPPPQALPPEPLVPSIHLNY